jgi:hypothetical protein
MLRCVDDSLGRILETLEDLELADNTLFIFFSDNGGNTHSWRADDPKLRNVTPRHPLHETIQSYRKWAGGEPPTNNAPLREGKGRIYEGGQRVPLMVRWPGHVQPGSTSDTVVGAIDLFPTVLDAADCDEPTDQIIDGVSFLPVLTGTGSLERDAYFTWFPHLIPAVSVRRGDWKLIRRFEPHPDYPETRELYNLRKDIGETTNLAEEMPDKVAELDALIDRFIEGTGALAPKPNPAYVKPDAASGLVPKMCKITLIDGALRVEADGPTPFLGTAQVKHSGPLTLNLRARSAVGGAGKVQWKTTNQEGFPVQGQAVAFTLPGGDRWQEIAVELPIEGTTAIVRLYLPAADSPVEIQFIAYSGQRGRVRAWDFRDVEP